MSGDYELPDWARQQLLADGWLDPTAAEALRAELASALAEVEELRAWGNGPNEREGRLIAEENLSAALAQRDAAVLSARVQRDMAKAQRDTLLPVAEAANAWYRVHDAKPAADRDDTESDLLDAVDEWQKTGSGQTDQQHPSYDGWSA